MLVERFWQAFKRHRAGRSVILMYHVLDQHHAPIAASAIAFDAFLSLVPLTAFAGLVMHKLHESGELVLRPILRASPPPVAGLVNEAVGRLAENAAVIAPVSIGAFLWTSSAGLSTAMYVFENMFHSPPRPWWKRRALAIVCVVAAIAVIALVTAAGVGVGMLSSHAGAAAAVVIPTATIIGMLIAFFRIAVRRGPVFQKRRVLPGVVVTVVLWSLLSVLFSFYVTTIARYATLYGGLAAVAIFLFWLWLLALALMVGGEVNAQLDGVRDSSG